MLRDVLIAAVISALGAVGAFNILDRWRRARASKTASVKGRVFAFAIENVPLAASITFLALTNVPPQQQSGILTPTSTQGCFVHFTKQE